MAKEASEQQAFALLVGSSDEPRAPCSEQGQPPGEGAPGTPLTAQPRVPLQGPLPPCPSGADSEADAPARSRRSSRSPLSPPLPAVASFGLWRAQGEWAAARARLRSAAGLPRPRGPCARERGRRRREGGRGGEGRGGWGAGREADDQGLNLDANLNRYCPSQGRTQEREPRLHVPKHGDGQLQGPSVSRSFSGPWALPRSQSFSMSPSLNASSFFFLSLQELEWSFNSFDFLSFRFPSSVSIRPAFLLPLPLFKIALLSYLVSLQFLGGVRGPYLVEGVCVLPKEEPFRRRLQSSAWRRQDHLSLRTSFPLHLPGKHYLSIYHLCTRRRRRRRKMRNPRKVFQAP